jgi:Putative regulator of cell autolysis
MINRKKKNRNSWNLDQKISFYFSSMIYFILFILLSFFISFYISSFIRQSNNITENQLTALASNYNNILDNYQQLSIALVIDDSIQKYLKYNGTDENTYYSLASDVKRALQNAVDMDKNLCFIAVIGNNSERFQFKGLTTKIANNFKQVYRKDYENSPNAYKAGTLRISFNQTYVENNQYTLNIYMPVYSTSKMINVLGMICMIFDNDMFEGLSEDRVKGFDSDVFIVDSSNRIVSASDFDAVGTEFTHAENFLHKSGYFRDGFNLYNYKKIGDWNFYLVSRVTLMNMYKNCIIAVVFLLLLSIVAVVTNQVVFKKMIYKAYKPLDNVVKSMNCVAEGNLDIRIHKDNLGNDFDKMAIGFNYMMDEINTLLEQVKLEQGQMDQIRFNALQSQIQPHFLYNALDSIYWQAMADGNEQISVFVKALSRYYRLCLNKGRDVISLSQEIEHVKNYLIIQNIRYENIIESEIHLEDSCQDVLIPKITLQPLVENSIYHGIKVKDGFKGKITINTKSNGEDVYIIVEDNGTGMSEEQIAEMNNSISEYDKDFGYGIRNVNKRIEILYGKEYGLHYEKSNTGGVIVIVRLPVHMKQKYVEVMECTVRS